MPNSCCSSAADSTSVAGAEVNVVAATSWVSCGATTATGDAISAAGDAGPGVGRSELPRADGAGRALADLPSCGRRTLCRVETGGDGGQFLARRRGGGRRIETGAALRPGGPGGARRLGARTGDRFGTSPSGGDRHPAHRRLFHRRQGERDRDGGAADRPLFRHRAAGAVASCGTAGTGTAADRAGRLDAGTGAAARRGAPQL